MCEHARTRVRWHWHWGPNPVPHAWCSLPLSKSLSHENEPLNQRDDDTVPFLKVWLKNNQNHNEFSMVAQAITPSFWRPRQDDHEFEATQGYSVGCRTAWDIQRCCLKSKTNQLTYSAIPPWICQGWLVPKYQNLIAKKNMEKGTLGHHGNVKCSHHGQVEALRRMRDRIPTLSSNTTSGCPSRGKRSLPWRDTCTPALSTIARSRNN